MRARDLGDYLKLRRIASNPWDVIRFRKGQRPGRDLAVRLRDGHAVHLRGGRQDASLFRNIWLDDEYRLSPHRGDDWECVIDLGANVGMFASRAARIARRTICYEPVEDNFTQLRLNVRDWPSVETVRSAVGATGGTLRLFTPADDRGTGRYSAFIHDGTPMSENTEEVPCISLDDLFTRHDVKRCDLLKIDVEGAEYDILYAASPETLSRIDRIHGEYHDVRPEDPRTRIDAFRAHLEGHGFKVDLKEKKEGNYGLFFAYRDVRRG